MDDDETLQKIRRVVFAKVEYAVATTEDGWRHDVKDLLPFYLQFKLLDRLEAIEGSLDRSMHSVPEVADRVHNS